MLKPFLPEQVSKFALKRSAIPAIAFIGLAVAWAWLPVLRDLVERWSSDPQYSHGFLIPFVALYIGHLRMTETSVCESATQSRGLLLVAIGGFLYWLGAHLYFQWIEQASLLPVIFGTMLLIGGRWLGRVSWPAVAYLLFMIPLPYRVEVALALPLQTIAGKCSELVLQTCGIAAIRTGNLIRVEEHVLGVAEACSGMRMMVVFFAISVAVALIIRRHWVENTILIVSAVPIAIFCNVVRISVTGLLYVFAGPELAEFLFHDLAGWLMMPAALAILALELKDLTLVFPASPYKEALCDRPAIAPGNFPDTMTAGVVR